MSKHYTKDEAKKEIGKSVAWRDGRRVAIKKWKEIVEYDDNYYASNSSCGYCFVEKNRVKKRLEHNETCGYHCPARKICEKVNFWHPETILKAIRRLKR